MESRENHDLLISLRTDMEWIKKSLEDYKCRLDDLSRKIDRLNSFKWKLVGFAIGVSSIISFVVSLLTVFHLF